MIFVLYLKNFILYYYKYIVILKITIIKCNIKMVDRLYWVVDRQYFILCTPERKCGRSGIGNNVSTAGSNYRTHRERYCKRV